MSVNPSVTKGYIYIYIFGFYETITFLIQTEKMFNIFEKEREFMEDDTKLRFIFKKVQHTRLEKTVEAPRVTQRTTPTAIAFSISSNNLSTAVHEFLSYIQSNRVVSTTGKLNIYDTDGGIMTEKNCQLVISPLC